MADVIQETMQQFDVGRGQNIGTDLRNEKLEEYECRDVHISTDANTSLVSKVCTVVPFSCKPHSFVCSYVSRCTYNSLHGSPLHLQTS